MDMIISIPDEVLVRLKERADLRGQTVPAYTAKLLADTVTKPSLDELLSPVRADFAASGMTDDELMAFGRDVLKSVRLEKKAKPA